MTETNTVVERFPAETVATFADLNIVECESHIATIALPKYSEMWTALSNAAKAAVAEGNAALLGSRWDSKGVGDAEGRRTGVAERDRIPHSPPDKRNGPCARFFCLI